MLADRILFVDAEAIVIDKPAGLPVDAPRRGGGSVAAQLDDLKLGFKRAPAPVHRLDQDTSGCLLLARTPKAMKRFGQAFERGEIEKVYLAVIDRELAGAEGLIDLPLRKISSAEEGWRMVGHPEGQPAKTLWRLLAVRDGRSLLELRPLSGRTHQLRVHAREALGAPIVGDPFYGGGEGPMMLHALRLTVARAPKAAIDVTAPLPPHFAQWADAA